MLSCVVQATPLKTTQQLLQEGLEAKLKRTTVKLLAVHSFVRGGQMHRWRRQSSSQQLVARASMIVGLASPPTRK